MGAALIFFRKMFRVMWLVYTWEMMLVAQHSRCASMLAVLQLGMLGLMQEILSTCGEDCQRVFQAEGALSLRAALRAAILMGRGQPSSADRPVGHC